MAKWLNRKNMVLVLILLGILLVGMILFSTKTASDGETGDIKIHTQYCDLYYPSRWRESIKILQTEDTVQFRADIDGNGLQPLLDIHFNSDEGIFCGMISTEGHGEVSVSKTTYPIKPDAKWNQEQLEMIYEMQDACNTLLSKLSFVIPEDPEEQQVPQASETTTVQEEQQTSGDIEIETPYGILRYPERWLDNLRLNKIEADICTVEFYANVGKHPEQHLFDVHIGPLPEGGMELYTENGKTVSVDIAFFLQELDQTWKEVDADIIYAMMDDVNYLVGMLDLLKPNS